MDLITCPVCKQAYSSSYSSCPFCEEEREDDRKVHYKRTPRRRVADRKKTQSARGGLIAAAVLVLVLAAWAYFGGDIFRGKEKPVGDDVSVPQDSPALPVDNIGANTDPFQGIAPDASGTNGPGTTDPGAEDPGTDAPGGDEPAQPTPEPVNVDVSGAKLNRDDFTLGYAGEKFTIRLSGTEAAPTWIVDNPNVATINAEGTVTAVANGDTKVHCKVGDRDITCVVRVRNTGKSAGPADAPMVVQPITPTAPANPASSTPVVPAAPAEPSTPPAPSTPSTPAAAHVDASALSVKTNYGTTLQKDPGSGYPDCTVRIGGDPIALRIVGTDVPVSSWESDKTSVVTVSPDGKLTPVSAGTAHVTAKVGDAEVTCIIRVR